VFVDMILRPTYLFKRKNGIHRNVIAICLIVLASAIDMN